MPLRFDQAEVVDLLAASHRAEILRLIQSLSLAAIAGRDRAPLVEQLGSRLSAMQTLSHLVGQAGVLGAADTAAGERIKAAVPVDPPAAPSGSGGLPRVTFDEAVTAVISREPRLAEVVAGEPRYKAVQRIYKEGGFSAAKAVDQTVVERVQLEIARGIQQGVPLSQLREDVKRTAGGMADWTDAYTDNVIRTNMAGAHADGILDQMKDPDVARVTPALMYEAIDDGDARPNHLAANGMVLPPGHPLVRRWTPPNGYRCRCGWSILNRNQLRALDLLDAQGNVIPYIPPGLEDGSIMPDEGFA